MRKTIIFAIIGMLLLAGTQILSADSSFKFPKMIKFKMLKNGKVMGSCMFFYDKNTDLDGISSLRMKNFKALGITSREWLFTYIFTRNSSIYADFIMKGKKPVAEIRLKDGTAFDGTKGKVFIYKDLTSPGEMQTEIFTKHTVVDLLSMFFVTSQKVGKGNIKKTEQFNFLFDKSTKIVRMVHMGKEKAPFDGKNVTTEVFSFSYHNREIFRLKIFKDGKGYCFPVSVMVVMDFEDRASGNVEMRADSVKR